MTSKISLYRKTAEELLANIDEVREWTVHKPTIGSCGEYYLTQAVKKILPHGYDVCQGFIAKNKTEAKKEECKQCDLIIFREHEDAVLKSFENTKIVNPTYVVAVIEIKTSVQRKTFISTMECFETWRSHGINNCILFVYGNVSSRRLYNYLFSNAINPQTSENDMDFVVSDCEPLDYGILKKLPKAIVSLASSRYFTLERYPSVNGDSLYYLSYDIRNKTNTQVHALQEFFEELIYNIDDTSDYHKDFDEYSIEDSVRLFNL